MAAIRVVVLVLLAAAALQAQMPPAPQTGEAALTAAIASLEGRQTVQSLSQALRTLQANLKVPETVKAQVDKLASDATQLQSTGNAGEARRRLLQAIAIQRGLPWDSRAEFAGSLILRSSMLVVDSARTFYAQLTQVYGAPYRAPKGLRVHVTAADFAAPAKVIRDLGTFEVYSRDLLEEPCTLSASLDGLADGPYQLAAEIVGDGAALRKLTLNILTVRDLDEQHTAVEQRLARVKGFESAKATIRYPFDYARVINLGKRDLIMGRNPEDNTVNAYYDFSAEIRNSAALLKSLEAGKDPLFRARGEHARHYAFTEAGEIMPYRVFVPSKFDGRTALPLVVVLHGSGADQDTYFKLRGPALTTAAERHGFVVVTPLGYRPTGGWGRSSGPMAAPGGRGGTAAPADPGRTRTAELSEKDAFNVIDMVEKEYGTDRSRTYLMGNSMGGAGTWYLGTKYPERWAAIAPCASPSVGEGFPIDTLKRVNVMYTVGEKDNVERSREMIKYLKANGLDIPYTEVPNGTHDMSIWENLPQIFNFFEKHRK